MVSFYDPKDFNRDTGQTQLVNALLQKSLQPQQIRHPVQGWAQLGQTAVATAMANKARSEEEQRRQALADALGTASQAGGAEGMIEALRTNPDTAPYALEIALQSALKGPETVEVYDPEENVYRRILADESPGKISKPGPQAKAPKTREVKRDGQIVTQEFGPEGWQDVATAPRWDPKSGGPSLGQQAGNTEIATARRLLKQHAKDAEELERKTTKSTSTGRTNQEYSENLSRIARTALQRKTGVPDPEFDALYEQYLGVPPEPAPIPGPKPEASPTDTSDSGFRWPRLPNPLDVLGLREPPPTEIEGPVRPVPRDASGRIDRSRLQKGQTYEAADGSQWRFDGEKMVEVQ